MALSAGAKPAVSLPGLPTAFSESGVSASMPGLIVTHSRSNHAHTPCPLPERGNHESRRPVGGASPVVTL